MEYKVTVEPLDTRTPKRWDWVWVRNDINGKWIKQIYLATIEWVRYPHYCVLMYDDDLFKEWKQFRPHTWLEMKPITPKREVTMQEIADQFGIPVEDLVIKKEQQR